ncbi:MAG: TetR/AcrR family transcriptional regulator [Myxococcota bacterium]|nr:TetR/AcrR family transcriptional regulator [Myxococcota bacterium]MDW8360836.1 helix-turn-helix domain-containing protein [Myxococcales bacterium]
MGRYPKSERSAALIVQSALRVLARKGHARTSLHDIAVEAGMSKGAVHYHFPTKDALVRAVLEHACDTVARRTLEAWSRGNDPLSALRAAIEELWRVRAERTDEVRVIADLLAHSQHDATLRPSLADYYRYAAAQSHEHLMKHLVAAGLRPRVPAELLPRLLLGLLDGLLMQVFVDPDALRHEDVVAAVLAIATALFEPATP